MGTVVEVVALIQVTGEINLLLNTIQVALKLSLTRNNVSIFEKYT